MTLLMLLCMLQLNVTTAEEAHQTVNTSDFYIQLNLTSNDTRFNNTHPRLQVGFLLIHTTRLFTCSE